MEFRHDVWPAAFGVKAHFEFPEKLQEIMMGLFIIVLCRTVVAFHAILLLRKVYGYVGFHKPDQLDAKLNLLPARIGDAGQSFQPVDVIDQHLVLGINQRMSGLKFVSPLQHCFNSRFPVLPR
jgi:hypothetical protein